MEFIDIKKGTHLSVEQMNAIYNNFQYIKNKLEAEGLKVGELVDSSVDYSTSPIDILPKFNAVETNIQILHKVFFNLLGRDEKFYQSFEWTPTTANRKNEVWRWIDWLYNAKNMSLYYEELYDVNNELITDLNNEPILVITAKEQ